MAKLNVVIPAVEVTVGDVTYRKVDRKAQAGDIVKALTDEDGDITQGAFYRVYLLPSGKPAFKDDVDDARSYQLAECQQNYVVFESVSEPAASDTVTFEGATWRKVDRDVREGDAIKFTDEDRSSYLRDSELYVVNEVDFNDDPHIADDDEDSYDAGRDAYEVYEKVAEEKTQITTPQYREVKRKASEGERIKIVAIHPRSMKAGSVSVGEELTVKTVDSSGDIWSVEEREFRGIIAEGWEGVREYVVLEPVNAEPTKPERLAVGDCARYVRDGNNAMVTGDIVEITEVDRSLVPYRVKRLTDGYTAWAPADKLVRATDEEVAAIKDPRSQFAAGDKVRLVSGGGAPLAFDYENGGIYTVKNPKYDSSKRGIQLTGGGQPTAYVGADQLVKLTTAEIAEIERKQAEEAAKRAEEARWNAIVRKVNEYKRGDLIEIVRYQNGDGVGTITEVVENLGTERGTLSYKSKKHGSGTRLGDFDAIKLIVPVEQRFDCVEEVDAA